MTLTLAMAVAAVLGATERVPDGYAGERAPRRWELAVSAGPAWVGGRLGVGQLSLDQTLGAGGFLAVEGLVRLSHGLALGASVEGIADAPASASAPPCGEGAGRGCDAAYTRFSALGRWTFHRSGTGEAWVSGATGVGVLRLASYGTDSTRLELRGWEIATLAAGYDLGPRRLGLGVFVSTTAGLLTHVTQGPEGTRASGSYYAVRAGIRGALRLGDPVTPRSSGSTFPRFGTPRLAVPSGSAISLEPRVGVAVCGYCGLLLGAAATARTGTWIGGAFVEGATLPAMDYAAPTPGSPTVVKSAAFMGLLAGAAGDSQSVRLGLVAEGGAQAARANASFAAVENVGTRTAVGWFPFVGARATVGLRLRGNTLGSVGIAAFVRQPLSAPCMDVGTGCERPATTVGFAFQASLDVRRSGPATPDADAPPAAAGPAP